jgi:hypothetical protein
MHTRDRRRPWLLLLGLLLCALLAWWVWPDPTPEVAAVDRVAPGPEPVAKPRPAPRRPPRAPIPVTRLDAPVEDDPAAELRNDPRIDAICRVEPAISGTLHLSMRGHEPPYNGRMLPLVEGEAFLAYVGASGAGVLSLDGYQPVSVSWGQGACLPDPIVLVEGRAWVVGMVRNAQGRPEGNVFVEGCGARSLTAEDGSYAMTVAPGSCSVSAFRHDGLLMATAGPVPVEAVADREAVVDLALPETPRAGLGIVFQSSAAGVRIRDVLPETAAFDAGFEPGDLIVELDGEPTGGISTEAFVEAAVGEAGTEVEVVVVRDGEQEAWLLDRRVLERRH